MVAQEFKAYFPLVFVSMWLVVTTALAASSGWFRLMTKFPDQTEEPLLQLRWQSGSMGLGVRMRGILTLAVCPSGLRVRMMRLFGPFCRDFLVPWEAINITRKMGVWSRTTLRFGNPAIGTLTIPAHVASKLASAAMERWPEDGPPPREDHGDTVRRLLIRWALMTCAGAVFFTVGPMVAGPAKGGPPFVAAILLPAFVFGVAAIVSYLRDRN